MAKKVGFDKPLKIVTEYDLKSLRGLLASKAPIGKPRPKGYTVGGKRYTYRNPPPPPGELRKSFYRKGAVRLNRKGTGIIIDSDVPYARAVDKGRKGGKIIRPVVAKFLMFPHRGKYFHKKARMKAMKGRHFVKEAADEWRKRRGIKAAIKVRWKPFRTGAA